MGRRGDLISNIELILSSPLVSRLQWNYFAPILPLPFLIPSSNEQSGIKKAKSKEGLRVGPISSGLLVGGSSCIA
jgi:hypothetical protein